MARRALVLEDAVYRRAGHVMVSYMNKLYLWGGYMEEPHEGNYNLMTPSSSHYHSPEDIWVYEPLLDTWSRKICQGDIPSALSGACAAVCGDYMYLFGGFNGDGTLDQFTSNELWSLFLPSLKWTNLSPSGFKPYPCDKISCWVYKNRFYIFGGFGLQMPPYPEPPVKVLFETENNGFRPRGWMDQLTYYDIAGNAWVWIASRGEKPSPRAAHAAAVLEDTAYIFGGRHKDQRLNDFYSLDMIKHVWNKVTYSDPSCQMPCGRSWHTLNSVSTNKLVLYGGFSTNCEVLNDVWLFDSHRLRWSKVPLPQPKPRLWHHGSCIEAGELTVVGGISSNILDNFLERKEHADDMVCLRFSPPSLFRLILEYLSKRKDLTRDAWNLLPMSVSQILKFRTDDVHIHGRWEPLFHSQDKT